MPESRPHRGRTADHRLTGNMEEIRRAVGPRVTYRREHVAKLGGINEAIVFDYLMFRATVHVGDPRNRGGWFYGKLLVGSCAPPATVMRPQPVMKKTRNSMTRNLITRRRETTRPL